LKDRWGGDVDNARQKKKGGQGGKGKTPEKKDPASMTLKGKKHHKGVKSFKSTDSTRKNGLRTRNPVMPLTPNQQKK